MKFISFLSLIFISLTCCCQSYTKEIDNKIIMVFDSIPIYERRISPFPKFEIKDSRPQISIFDNFNKYNFNPKFLKEDTIVFFTNSKNIAIEFRYKLTKEPIHYVVGNGDVINFKFKNGIPYVSGRSTKLDSLLNYEYYRILRKGGPEHNTAYDIYSNTYLEINKIEELFLENKIKSKWYETVIDSLKNEQKYLIKLKTSFSQGSATIDLLLDKLFYQIAKIDFEQHKLSKSTIENILEEQKSVHTEIPYSYFLEFLESISDSVNVKTSKTIPYKNGKEVDYREVYDRTKEWNKINDFYKKHLLYQYLIKIGNIFPESDLDIYLLKFSNTFKDTLLSNRIRQEFPIVINSTYKGKDSLYLINHKKTNLTFKKLLDANKGKIVYVDFWASWCGPCRESMIASHKLRKKLKDKNIAFVYLSIDDKIMAWQNASSKEGLTQLNHSYLITNYKTSDFFTKNKLSEIPRYMIFDKTGKLIYGNAPRPENSETENLLIKLEKNTNY